MDIRFKLYLILIIKKHQENILDSSIFFALISCVIVVVKKQIIQAK